MYRLDWIEQLKQRLPRAARSTDSGHVHPAVYRLGLTSFLTDISSEMVNSLLPAYIVLYLHLSPLQYGVISGVYNGAA